MHAAASSCDAGVLARSCFEPLANIPTCVVGMEACCGAHHLGRMLATQGHDVRLTPPQYVKPFVKSKNSICKRFHRVRSRPVARRTAVINQLRGFLLERGLTFPSGRRALVERLPDVLAYADVGLSPRFYQLLTQLREEWRVLDEAIHNLDHEVATLGDGTSPRGWGWCRNNIPRVARPHCGASASAAISSHWSSKPG